MLAAVVCLCALAHGAGTALAHLTEDLVWADAITGVFICAASAWLGAAHARHLVPSVLFATWGLRLSLHVAARRALLGKHRARCLSPSLPHMACFAIMRVSWAVAIIITMWGIPPIHGALQLEVCAAALLALVGEAYADFELLRHRVRDAGHALYTGGLWGLCRHPNMFCELAFQMCMCLLSTSLAYPWGATALACTLMCVCALPGGIHTLEARARASWGSTEQYRAYVRATPLILPIPIPRPARSNITRVCV